MAFTIPRVSFMVVLFSFLVLSIAILALKTSTLNFISANYETGGFEISLTPTPQDPRDHRTLGFLPLYLYRAPAKLAIAVGALSMLTSLAGLAFTIFFWPDGKRTYKFAPRKDLSVVYLFNALLVLIAFIYLFATHAKSAHFNALYNDPQSGFGPGSVYTGGKFDLETWVCDLTAFRGIGNQFNLYSIQCNNEAAGRWMFLSLLLLAFATPGVAFWALGKEVDSIRQGEESLRKRRAFWHSDGWEEMGDSRTHGLEGLPRERFVGAS
ncbi:MAG: hypothetical protein M1836_005804 [Candelina mexicana]|nr:MAG: hypothetical protein M1836_005804 [Candelina mexicana]